MGGKNLEDCLVYVSKGYISNLGSLGPLLHVEKFVVLGGVQCINATFYHCSRYCVLFAYLT